MIDYFIVGLTLVFFLVLLTAPIWTSLMVDRVFKFEKSLQEKLNKKIIIKE